LKKGESQDIDLDGDGVVDICGTFSSTYNNRAEITIHSLAKVIAAVGPNTASSTPNLVAKFIFQHNLSVGSVSNDVKELQKFLNARGFVIAKSGAGSSGQETAKFGALTRQALIKFQKANKISPAVGYFGPLTRKMINGK
jgi:peptidoglycan hydrolase-like protein with peptidoglycan-binding domain